MHMGQRDDPPMSDRNMFATIKEQYKRDRTSHVLGMLANRRPEAGTFVQVSVKSEWHKESY